MPDENPDILNEGCDFVRAAPLHVRQEFEGIPAKVLLGEGEALFRFLEAGLRGLVSDFWLPLETYHRLRLAASVPEWAISRSAGSKARGAPAAFCRATLTRKVYGFKGCVRSAGKGGVTMENLFASGMVWIPGLTAGDFFLRCYSLVGLPLS